jgi:hypothetical protein
MKLLTINNWDEFLEVICEYPQLKRHPRMKDKMDGLNLYVDASLIAMIADLESEIKNRK